MPQGQSFYKINENPFSILGKSSIHMRGMMGQFFIGIVVIYVIMNWTPEFLSMAFPYTVMDFLVDIGKIDSEIAAKISGAPTVAMYLFALLFNGVMKLGKALYVLTFMRNRKVEYGAIAEGFRFYFKALLLFLVETFIVAVWAMLLIIPGIIAAIAFSQSFFILADNPEKGVFEILSESKMRMFGNKMTYVKLIVAYIPYFLIAYLPIIVISNLSFISSETISGIIVLLIAEIPLFCAYGFLSLGQSVFYELLISEGFDNFRYTGEDAFRQELPVRKNIRSNDGK